MSEPSKIPLSRRYEVPGYEPFDSVSLREPTYAERYIEGLGAPFDWQPDGRGGKVLIVYPGVVAQYLERCVVTPDVKAIIGISVRDAGRLEAALLDFFTDGPTPSASPISSSSGSDGGQGT